MRHEFSFFTQPSIMMSMQPKATHATQRNLAYASPLSSTCQFTFLTCNLFNRFSLHCPFSPLLQSIKPPTLMQAQLKPQPSPHFIFALICNSIYPVTSFTPDLLQAARLVNAIETNWWQKIWLLPPPHFHANMQWWHENADRCVYPSNVQI